MDAVVEGLGRVPADGWYAAAAAGALVAGLGLFPHARRAFHQWRLDRRLARDPVICREELRDDHWLIDDALKPLEPWALVRGSLAAGLITGAWVTSLGTPFAAWWDYAQWALLGGGLLYATWRWHNDPPEMRGEDARHPLAGLLVEREAVLGLGGAIAIVLVILFAVAALA